MPTAKVTPFDRHLPPSPSSRTAARESQFSTAPIRLQNTGGVAMKIDVTAQELEIVWRLRLAPPLARQTLLWSARKASRVAEALRELKAKQQREKGVVK